MGRHRACPNCYAKRGGRAQKKLNSSDKILAKKIFVELKSLEKDYGIMLSYAKNIA